MPTTIAKVNEKVLDSGFLRQTQALHSAIDGLTIKENKSKFFETSMYVFSEPESYENNSGKFLKNYTRLSKYCGDSNGDCFAKEYWQYVDNKKEAYTPEYKGACGILKSGVSICLVPQIGGNPIKGIMDINGPKEPNVFGRDLRPFVLDAISEQVVSKETGSVLTHTAKPIDTPDPTPDPTPEPIPLPDPCRTEPKGQECCLRQVASTYRTTNKHCCNYLTIADKYPQYCGKDIRVSLSCTGYQATKVNEECAQLCLWGHNHHYYHHCEYKRGDCMDITYQCGLVAENTDDDFALQIKYYKSVPTVSYHYVGSVDTYNKDYITVTANCVKGGFGYELRNLSSGEVIDRIVPDVVNSSGGGNDAPLGFQEHSPGAMVGDGGMSYSYTGRPR